MLDTVLDDRENDNKYFIHQAGVYVRTPHLEQPFFSPIVAEHYNPTDESYSVVNWGQQAHIDDNVDVLFTADLLYYTKYTNLGAGIIQVDNMIYNFGPDAINHLNMPWGGVRNSTLGNFFVSSTNGTYNHTPGQVGTTDSIDVEDTNGWVAFSSDINGNSSSLAHVFNQDESLADGIIRWGRVGGETNPRDYFLYTLIKRPVADIEFGRSMQFRHYYIIDSDVVSIKDKIQQYELTAHTLERTSLPIKRSVKDLYYNISQLGSLVTAEISDDAEFDLSIKSGPYRNSYPLFQINGEDDSSKITTNLYVYSDLPYDGRANDWTLLGYVDNKTNIFRQHEEISYNDSYTFPDGHLSLIHI